jgi:hypothetical protein
MVAVIPGEAAHPEEVRMGSGHIEQSETDSLDAELDESTKTEYLDLDNDGVLDAVQTSETRKYARADGADVVEETRELDSSIGLDGLPTTVTVTDAVTIDTDHDGAPNAAEVITVITHPAGRANDQPELTNPDEDRTR